MTIRFANFSVLFHSLQEFVRSNVSSEKVEEVPVKDTVVHESNEWGMSLNMNCSTWMLPKFEFL